MFLRLSLGSAAIFSFLTIAGCGQTDPAAANKATLDREYKTASAEMLEIAKHMSQFSQLLTDTDPDDMPEIDNESVQSLAKQQLALFKRTRELTKQYAELGLTPPTLAEMGLDDSFVEDTMKRALEQLERIAQSDKKGTQP